MNDNPKGLSLPRFLVIAVLLLTCIGLEYYFHFVLGVHTVYTHIFYIPIVLAALWWGLSGGLTVGSVLFFIHLLFHYQCFLAGEFSAMIADVSRGLMFVVVGLIVGFLSSKRASLFALLEKEKNFNDSVINSMHDILLVADLKGDIISANKAAARILGYTVDELVGESVLGLFPESEIENVKTGMRTSLETDYDSRESILLTKKGKEIPANFRGSVLKDAEGNPYAVFCVARDVTREKKMEEDLRASEQKYRTLFEYSGRAVALIAPDTTLLVVNKKFEELSGYSKEEVEGKISWTRFVAEKDKERMLGYHKQRRIDQTKVPTHYEFTFVRKDGEERVIDLAVSVIHGTDLSIASLQDITEHKKAEEERRILYEAISSSSEGIALGDAQDKYIYVNEAHARMHGYAREELLGKTWRDITPAEYVKRAEKEIVPVLMETGRWGSEFVALRKNGETFPIWLSITALFDEERNFTGHICAVRDITERKRFEKDLQRKILELTTLSEVSADISSTLELDRVLTMSLESALKLLDAEAGSIMLLDKKKEFLTVAASHGLSKEFAHARERLGEGIAGYVAKSGEPLLLKEDMKDTRFEKLRKERRIKDALSVPIKAEDRIIGAFNVNDKNKGTFTQSDLRLFTILALEMGVAIENARLYQDVKQGLLNTVKALAVAVDAKDPYTKGHSERVAEYSSAMAGEMGLSKEEIEEIEIAAHLHDVGKIGVSEEILGKPVALTKEEWKIIKEHPKTSVKILEPVAFPSEVVSYVLSHHERPDGKGYPNGISKDEIPLGASIIKVADAFDAMTSERPYREALSTEEAISELKRNAGTQFQPKVVEAFLGVYEREIKGQKDS